MPDTLIRAKINARCCDCYYSSIKEEEIMGWRGEMGHVWLDLSLVR